MNTHVVDNLGADPNLGGRRGLNDGAQVGLGNEVSLSLLECLGRSVSLCRGLGVDIDLSASLSGSESVLLSLGTVDDLSRNPNTGSGNELSGCCNFSLGDGHDISHGLGDCLCLHDRCGNSLGLYSMVISSGATKIRSK